MTKPGKLYFVLRADLAPGLQASQAVHAGHTWAIEHPEEFRRWFRDSNTVVLVNAPDADALDALFDRARSVGVPVSAFVDDDLGPRLTSVALGPCDRARKLCQTFPLALQSPKGVAA